MICPNCGAEVAPGSKFCGNCGTAFESVSTQTSETVDGSTYVVPPVPNGTPAVQYDPMQSPKKSKVWIIILIIVAVLALIVGGLYFTYKKIIKRAADFVSEYPEYSDDGYEDLDAFDLPEIDTDDFDGIYDQDYDFDFDEEYDFDEYFDEDFGTGETDDFGSGVSGSYDYAYASAVFDGDLITITPNGQMNDSTVVYNGKDLGGLCDYVDNNLLETGRTLNRELFYQFLSISIVDPEMYTDFEDIEMSLVYSLATANNFFGINPEIKSCEIDQTNPNDYKYDVTLDGRDDTWIIDYTDKEVYFNNGATQYTSDMFKDEYLAVWMIAVEDYYGVD